MEKLTVGQAAIAIAKKTSQTTIDVVVTSSRANMTLA